MTDAPMTTNTNPLSTDTAIPGGQDFRLAYSSVVPKFADDDSVTPCGFEIWISGLIESVTGDDLYPRAKAIVERCNTALASPPPPIGQGERECTVCNAVVASWPAVMCCHCAEMPWKLVGTPTGSAEPEIPAGMKPWRGGDGAPKDWDGGPVLMVDPSDDRGDTFVEVNVPPAEMPWRRTVGWKVIVAYTPKPVASQRGGDALREAVRKAGEKAEARRGEVILHASDWLAIQDALSHPTTTAADKAGEPVLLEAGRPFAEWNEDHRDVLWWKLPVQEPPYVGTPLDLGRSMKVVVQVGFEEHDLPITMTGGWPFDEADESDLWWTRLPQPTFARTAPHVRESGE